MFNEDKTDCVVKPACNDGQIREMDGNCCTCNDCGNIKFIENSKSLTCNVCPWNTTEYYDDTTGDLSCIDYVMEEGTAVYDGYSSGNSCGYDEYPNENKTKCISDNEKIKFMLKNVASTATIVEK
jgi:hypothetical protein